MYRLIFVLLLLVAAIFYMQREYICSRLVVPDIVEWERPSQKTFSIYGDTAIRQYFVPDFDGLFRVGFPVEYKKPLETKIEVSLREKDTHRELFRETIPLKKFPKGKMRRFSFSPLWDSAGRSYYLNISAQNAGPETGLRFLYDTWPFFHKMKGGKLYVGNREIPGELSMVSECRVRVSKSKFLSAWHNFTEDKGFLVFYMGIIVAGLIGLVFLY